MPNVSSATSFFPRAVEGFVTTLASTISSGATTLTANSTAGYSIGDVIVWIIDPASSTAKQVLTGTVAAGNQIINVVWTYGTNQTHTAGATIVDYTTATGFDLVTTGIQKFATQGGILLQSPVITAIGTGGITATQLATGSVTAIKLDPAAIKLGRATNVTTAVLTGGAADASIISLTVTVPTGNTRDLELKAYIPNLSDGGASVGTFKIWKTSIGGTLLNTAGIKWQGSDQHNVDILAYDLAPTAGSTTYILSGSCTPANLQYNVSATSPAILSANLT